MRERFQVKKQENYCEQEINSDDNIPKAYLTAHDRVKWESSEFRNKWFFAAAQQTNKFDNDNIIVEVLTHRHTAECNRRPLRVWFLWFAIRVEISKSSSRAAAAVLIEAEREREYKAEDITRFITRNHIKWRWKKFETAYILELLLPRKHFFALLLLLQRDSSWGEGEKLMTMMMVTSCK